MPIMPQHDSKRSLTTQQPEPFVEATKGGEIAGLAAEAAAKTAGMITEGAIKWAAAVDTIQETTYKANITEAEADIKARAAADPDVNSYPKYEAELNKLSELTTKGITSSGVKKNAMFDAQHRVNLAKTDLGAVYKKKMIAVGQVSVGRLIESEVRNPTPDSPQNIKDIFAAQVKAGTFGAEEAYRLEKAAIKDANWNRFALTAKVNRDEAKKLAESGELNFDSDQADKAMNYLNNLKNIEDKNTLIDKIDNRYSLVDAIATGKEDIFNLSPQAQAMVDNDEILSAAVIKGQQKGKGYIPETTDVENYVKIFDDASKATDSDALSKLAVDSVYRDKTITPDKLGLVLFYAQQRAKNLMLSEKIIEPIGPETTPEQIQAMQMDAGVNAISRWAKGGAVDIKNHQAAITDFMTAVKGGAKPLEAINTTLKQANLRLHPEMVTYPKEGQLIIDAYGRQALAFPDGTIQSAPTPKSKTAQKPEAKTKEPLDFKSL